MKLRRTYAYSQAEMRQVDVDDAVQATIASYGDMRDGIAERAQSYAESCSTFLAALTKTLHDKGVLTDDEVLNLCSGFVKVE